MPKMAMAEQITEIMTTFTKPSGSSWNGKCTFVPHKLNMMVGTAIVIGKGCQHFHNHVEVIRDNRCEGIHHIHQDIRIHFNHLDGLFILDDNVL